MEEMLKDMKSSSEELTVEATLDNLANVMDFCVAPLEDMDAPTKIQFSLNLVVEEIFVNVANYAYKPQTGSLAIVRTVENSPLAIVLRFIDSGVPYNPLEKPDPDVTQSLEERQIGGLGIFLVKKNVDDIAYEYTNGQNILTVRKFIKA